jgi:hypothetical protein
MDMQKVDVLAVMKASAKRLRLGVEGPINADLLDESCAAVADLIAKADNAATALSNLIAARQVDAGYSGIVTDLTDALARIGAAA